MARTRTLAEIGAEILHRGDLRSVRHDPNSTELTRQINQSIMRVYRRLCKIQPDWYMTSGDTAVTAGTYAYALQADVYNVVGVDVLDGSYYYPLQRFNFAERHAFQAGSGSKRACRYRVVGDYIHLRPTPGWSGTIVTWYNPLPTDLSAPTDTFDGIAGYEELVILDAIIKFKAMDGDGEEAAIFAAQLKDAFKELEQEAADRDAGEPDRWRDPDAERLATGWPSW